MANGSRVPSARRRSTQATARQHAERPVEGAGVAHGVQVRAEQQRPGLGVGAREAPDEVARRVDAHLEARRRHPAADERVGPRHGRRREAAGQAPRLLAHRRELAAARHDLRGGHGAAGSVKRKALPPPSAGSTQMRPPWASTTRRHTARPMPVPSVVAVERARTSRRSARRARDRCRGRCRARSPPSPRCRAAPRPRRAARPCRGTSPRCRRGSAARGAAGARRRRPRAADRPRVSRPPSRGERADRRPPRS